MRDRIFNAANARGIEHLAGSADYEDVPQLLVKDDFRPHARIRTAENNGEGLLSLNEFGPALCDFVSRDGVEAAGDETLVARQQQREGFVSINR